jgi:hypothetical protein
VHRAHSNPVNSTAAISNGMSLYFLLLVPSLLEGYRLCVTCCLLLRVPSTAFLAPDTCCGVSGNKLSDSEAAKLTEAAFGTSSTYRKLVISSYLTTKRGRKCSEWKLQNVARFIQCWGCCGSIMVTVFQNVTSCSLVNRYQRFGSTSGLQWGAFTHHATIWTMEMLMKTNSSALIPLE